MKTTAFAQRCALFCLLVVFFGVGVANSRALGQEVDSAERLFPETTAIFLEVENPPQLIDTVMDHPLRDRIESMEEVQQLLKSPQFAMAMMGKVFLEKQLGNSWDDTLREITSEGLFLGFDLETQGIAVLLKAGDEAKLKKSAETFLNLTAMAAQNDGKKKPYEIKPYRQAKVADFGDFLVARMGTWFLISNQSQLAKKIADNLFDQSDENLANQVWFQEARQQRTENSLWSAVNLQAIRDAGVAKELFADEVDNPGVELLMGGVLDSLKNAAHASASFRLDESLQIELALPFDTKWASKTREYFYGPNLSGRSPGLVKPENTIANLVTYRDFGAWWLAKEDLFSEAVIAQMAQFDSQISTLFAGLDFGEEFLGGLKPGAQIVVVEHQVDTDKQPDVKIPGMALIAELNDAKMSRKLRVSYKNMIAILNLNLGMQGQPQLDAMSERMDGIQITSTEYMIDDDAEDGLLLYNFSPSIAFVNSHMVIASTRNLAVDIATKLKDQKFEPRKYSNTHLEVDGQQLQRILALNKEPLIANNMVEEGNSRKESEAEINTLLLIAKFFKTASMDYQVNAEQMKLDIQLDFQD